MTKGGGGIETATTGEPRKSKITAIILAAGFSSRMKSFKPLLPLGSASVIEIAVRSFQEAGFKDIRIVLGHRAGELIPVCNALHVQWIFNEHYAEGMFSSVKAGVISLGPEVEGFFSYRLIIRSSMKTPYIGYTKRLAWSIKV